MKALKNTNYAISSSISRRRFISSMGLMFALASCTPIRLLVSHSFAENNIKETLFSFMKAVVPGIDDYYRRGISFYFDPEYPFHKYLSVFISDLHLHARKGYRRNRFDQLTLHQQQELIRHRSKDLIIGNLYTGAIWFTQVIIYTGMAHPEGKSNILNFDGPYTRQDYSYENPDEYLGENLTENGNLT